ncbi:hypothetical protein A671_05374 [Salmonella enterica subsp. enterica serovar Dublin str. DG22]|nr:hypothetical protein A671_05374 [Salmonella enterica subsp. enterica serovar Dublin str. DG22]
MCTKSRFFPLRFSVALCTGRDLISDLWHNKRFVTSFFRISLC